MNLMFQPQFEPMILSGRKLHTVRPPRKRPLRIGQGLSLRVWTGLPYRSKQREFARAIVEGVDRIRITKTSISRNGRRLNYYEQGELAWKDGFRSLMDFRFWFENTHGFPCDGELIWFAVTERI